MIQNDKYLSKSNVLKDREIFSNRIFYVLWMYSKEFENRYIFKYAENLSAVGISRMPADKIKE